MRRWSLIVVLTATLALGASACGLKENEATGDLPALGDQTTEPGADPPTTDGSALDDPAPGDDPFGDDPFGDDPGEGPLGDDPLGEGGSGDDGSGGGSGGSGSGGDDFCSLAREAPDPTSVAAGEEFFERWLASAPEELREEIEVITDWYERSTSDPDAEMPEEVLDALITLGQYTVENCT